MPSRDESWEGEKGEEKYVTFEEEVREVSYGNRVDAYDVSLVLHRIKHIPAISSIIPHVMNNSNIEQSNNRSAIFYRYCS